MRTSFVTVDVAASPARYRLLEPVRQYARELLDASGQRDDRRRRHLEYYADFARALHDGEDESGIVPLDELLGELGNLRVALDWAAEAPEETDVGLWLAGDLYHVWTAGAHHAEGAGATRGPAAHRPRVAGRAIQRAARNAAIVAAHVGHGDRSLGPRRAGARRGGGRRQQRPRASRPPSARPVPPRPRRRRGRPGGPLRPRSRAGFEQTTDVDAFCLVTKVELDLVVGALDEAEATARRVLTGRFGSLPWLGPAVRFLLGEIMMERGDLEHARSWLNEALALSEAIGDSHSAVDAHLAPRPHRVRSRPLRRRRGRPLQRSGSIDAGPQHAPGTSSFLEAGVALALCGDSPGQAVGLAEAALARADEILERGPPVLCLRLLGDAQVSTGDLAGALATFEQLIARAEPVPSPCRVAEGHEGAAAVNNALGQVRAASGHLAKAAEIRQRTGTRTSPQAGARPARRPLIAYRAADNGSD